MKSNVESLIEKSIACAISAIEIYNKPDFKYREETFSILMINSWELILKAKMIKDSNNNIKVIYIKENIPKKSGGKSKKWKYKTNKRGYNLTLGIERLLEKYENDKNIDRRCLENIVLLNTVRNNAIHLINKDSELASIVYEVGSANLKNYIEFIIENFNKDLSKYNFYLMPISFYNDYEIIDNLKIEDTSFKSKIKKDLLELNSKYKSGPNEKYNIILATKVSFIKGDKNGINTKFINDTGEDAIKVNLTDEEFDMRYPLSYEDLVKILKERYDDFKQDKKFHELNQKYRKNKNNAYQKFLNNKNKNGNSRWQYNSNILNNFDKDYNKK